MLVAAPEGTCGDGRCILQFRSGCFLPGVPLLPILFKYNISCHNPAWTVINEGWHFVRFLCPTSVGRALQLLQMALAVVRALLCH